MFGFNGKTFRLCVQTIFVLLWNLIIIGELCSTQGYGDGPFDKKNMIDSDHLKKYPYCGSILPLDNTKEPSGRAVNAEPSKKLYRWVVYMKKETFLLTGKTEGKKPKEKLKKPKKEQKSRAYECSGTVITDR